MDTVVGIFNTRADAEVAVGHLKSAGVSDDRISLLTPGDSEERLKTVPTTEAEPPGVGEAIGAVVGGSIGVAGGLSLGAAAASLFVPGVGPVIAIGLAGAALLGAGGAAGGAALGEALDENMSEGVPIDELFVYESALRQGRSVVIVLTTPGRPAEAIRKLMGEGGAESIDSARDNWWLGLRSAEERDYAGQGRDFASDEAVYRNGFEAALLARTRGKSYDEVADYLKGRYPDRCSEERFRRGYERGRLHYNGLMKSHKQSA